MSAQRLLIANRSEISLRLQTGIQQLGYVPLGIYSASEGPFAPHLINLPDEQKVLIPGQGPAAYLDIDSIISAARLSGAHAVIPGYGFLSESSDFAQAVIDAGLTWIGPSPEFLRLFGDKHSAKRFAQHVGVPVLPSTSSDASLEEVQAFARGLPAGTVVLLKAVAGGGGRGIRVVESLEELSDAYNSCKREAGAAFGDERLFAEPLLKHARHIEVQVLGDGSGQVIEVGERECSLQRRHQKLIEICPSPTLLHHAQLRKGLLSAATRLASAGKLKTLATCEFLVTSTPEGLAQFYFLECNPRLQVEHTITEEVYGVDLVTTQIKLAFGAGLGDLAIGSPSPQPTKCSIQLRLNAERLHADGTTTGTTGVLRSVAFPTGPGVRIDTAAHGPRPPPIGMFKQGLDFDSLLAKAIFTGPSYEVTLAQAAQGLTNVRFDGLGTNKALLLALLSDSHVTSNRGIHTRFVEDNAKHLLEVVSNLADSWESAEQGPTEDVKSVSGGAQSPLVPSLPQGQKYVHTLLPGKLISLTPQEGSQVRKGDVVAVVESMKMEHSVRAAETGSVVKLLVSQGAALAENEALFVLQTDGDSRSAEDSQEFESEAGSLAGAVDSRKELLDEWQKIKHQSDDEHPYRQSATAKRHTKGFRTARENLADLIDADSLIEYGDLVVAAQRTRLEGEALDRTRNDGVIVGWATVNSSVVGSSARCAVVVYDYGVLAGTQGHFHHHKLDRIFNSVLAHPAPIIIYAEGGGGRPGDVDLLNLKVGGLDVPTFGLLARIKARGIPIISIANGNVFAGNAALLGCGDVIIATKHTDTSIGMGGPAMIAGGGLGDVKPRDVGPIRVHDFNGNVDIVVADEKEATAVAKQIVSVFQGKTANFKANANHPTSLRSLIPPSRKRAYEIRPILEGLSDADFGFVEIGAAWGQALVTGFIRIDGAPLALVASNVVNELGGAIDARSADKASRFIDILTRIGTCHLLALCDVPGFMVGTAAERTGSLRSFANYFTAGQAFQDKGGSIFGLVLRKAYGLGAQALLGGSTLAPFHSASWSTGEFGAMGIEGAVKLGMRKELEAIDDDKERAEMEANMVQEMYNRGKAVRMAEMGEIDTVIDPAETLAWLRKCLASVTPRLATVDQQRGDRQHSRL